MQGFVLHIFALLKGMFSKTLPIQGPKGSGSFKKGVNIDGHPYYNLLWECSPRMSASPCPNPDLTPSPSPPVEKRKREKVENAEKHDADKELEDKRTRKIKEQERKPTSPFPVEWLRH